MVLRHQLFQALTRHMGVNGGGADIRMPQQQLHHAQIRAVIKQVRSKCVAQSVWGQRGSNARFLGIFFHQVPKHGTGHGFTSMRTTCSHEDRIVLLHAQ